MTITNEEYAQLAARVYDATRQNRAEIPQGWEELRFIPDLSNGFSAGVYRRISTNEIASIGLVERSETHRRGIRVNDGFR